MVMNTPPTARTQAKHPAARVLENIAAQDVASSDGKPSEIDRLLLENSPQVRKNIISNDPFDVNNQKIHNEVSFRTVKFS